MGNKVKGVFLVFLKEKKCRDLVSIMRSSPYLLTHLIVPALADNIILVAKCHALLHGKT